MDEQSFTVTGLNEYVERLLQRDVFLSNLSVVGEVSGYKRHTSGHIYFLLKDQSSLVRCVFFRQYALESNCRLEDGMRVCIKGYASLYARDGQFQVYVQKVERQGHGALYEAFEQIKNELAARGYFDAERKRSIPAFARRIGVVTSESGAAIHDIITVSRRRNKHVGILLYPVAVQGENAAQEIAQGVYCLGQMPGIDVLIVGRGGGSIEDLWAFNDVCVAEAIYHSPVPIISAVGHETDFTIADFVADMRAATPSMAAEIAVFNEEECRLRFQHLRQRLQALALQAVSIQRSYCAQMRTGLSQAHPLRRLEKQRYTLEHVRQNLDHNVRSRIAEAVRRMDSCRQRLKSADPRAVLKRGYALVQEAGSGHIIYHADMLKIGQYINLQFGCGNARAQVTGIDGEEHQI